MIGLMLLNVALMEQTDKAGFVQVRTMVSGDRDLYCIAVLQGEW